MDVMDVIMDEFEHIWLCFLSIVLWKWHRTPKNTRGAFGRVWERESAVSDRNVWSKLSRLFQTTCIRTRLFDLRQCLCFASLPLCPPGVPRLIFWTPQLYNENVTDIKQTRSRRTWIKSDNCGKEKKYIQRDSKSEKCAHINVEIRSWSFPLKWKRHWASNCSLCFYRFLIILRYI